MWCCPPVQVLRFDLSAAAPDPTAFDLSNAVAGIQFQARAVRVIFSSVTATTLLVGGEDATFEAAASGVLLHGSVAAGSSTFTVLGSVVLPSRGVGVTALSQTSPLHPGFVLASTEKGVYKCV